VGEVPIIRRGRSQTSPYAGRESLSFLDLSHFLLFDQVFFLSIIVIKQSLRVLKTFRVFF
jgi:hypothetical protein